MCSETCESEKATTVPTRNRMGCNVRFDFRWYWSARLVPVVARHGAQGARIQAQVVLQVILASASERKKKLVVWSGPFFFPVATQRDGGWAREWLGTGSKTPHSTAPYVRTWPCNTDDTSRIVPDIGVHIFFFCAHWGPNRRAPAHTAPTKLLRSRIGLKTPCGLKFSPSSIARCASVLLLFSPVMTPDRPEGAGHQIIFEHGGRRREKKKSPRRPAPVFRLPAQNFGRVVYENEMKWSVCNRLVAGPAGSVKAEGEDNESGPLWLLSLSLSQVRGTAKSQKSMTRHMMR